MTDQTTFLLALGVKKYQNDELIKLINSTQAKIHESYFNFGLLMRIGMKFKVLIQQKGVDSKTLSGLRFLNV